MVHVHENNFRLIFTPLDDNFLSLYVDLQYSEDLFDDNFAYVAPTFKHGEILLPVLSRESPMPQLKLENGVKVKTVFGKLMPAIDGFASYLKSTLWSAVTVKQAALHLNKQ